jgi:hypothetical protein
MANGFTDLAEKLKLDPSEGWKYLCPGCRTKKSTNSSAEKEKPKSSISSASSSVASNNNTAHKNNENSFCAPQT